MKYEFVQLTDEYKSNENNFYIDELDKKTTINFTNLLNDNNGLKWPIAILANGVLVDSKDYSIDIDNHLIKFTNNDAFLKDDKSYMIFTSNSNNSKFIGQLNIPQFEKIDNDKIQIPSGFGIPDNNNLLGIFINGLFYYKNTFNVTEQIITFEDYCPDGKDIISFLYYM
jgi:hypothetical protein